MSEIKLLSCPFCGCEEIKIEPVNRWRRSITCKNCHAKFVAPDDPTLVKLWNTRKPMEWIVEQLERKKVENPNGMIFFGKNLAFDEAIEIVQKGGAE